MKILVVDPCVINMPDLLAHQGELRGTIIARIRREFWGKLPSAILIDLDKGEVKTIPIDGEEAEQMGIVLRDPEKYFTLIHSQQADEPDQTPA